LPCPRFAPLVNRVKATEAKDQLRYVKNAAGDLFLRNTIAMLAKLSALGFEQKSPDHGRRARARYRIEVVFLPTPNSLHRFRATAVVDFDKDGRNSMSGRSMRVGQIKEINRRLKKKWLSSRPPYNQQTRAKNSGMHHSRWQGREKMHREKRYCVLHHGQSTAAQCFFFTWMSPQNMQQCLRGTSGTEKGLVVFCRRKSLSAKLVWYAETNSAEEAWRAAKRMQHWPRADKIAAIVEMNPYWRDLAEDILK
jgi:hypothetical protein